MCSGTNSTNEPQPETYEALVTAKTVTLNAIKKLLAKAWCARRIMWPNKENGILVEVGGDGYYVVMPGAVISEILFNPTAL
jgi:hypothetical protein